jgi:hypothetical protein
MKIIIAKNLEKAQQEECDKRFDAADKYDRRFFRNIQQRRLDLAQKNLAKHQEAMLEYLKWKLEQGFISDLEYVEALLWLKKRVEERKIILSKFNIDSK